jgi:hypothetical protein
MQKIELQYHWICVSGGYIKCVPINLEDIPLCFDCKVDSAEDFKGFKVQCWIQDEIN